MACIVLPCALLSIVWLRPSCYLIIDSVSHLSSLITCDCLITSASYYHNILLIRGRITLWMGTSPLCSITHCISPSHLLSVCEVLSLPDFEVWINTEALFDVKNEMSALSNTSAYWALSCPSCYWRLIIAERKVSSPFYQSIFPRNEKWANAPSDGGCKGWRLITSSWHQCLVVCPTLQFIAFFSFRALCIYIFMLSLLLHTLVVLLFLSLKLDCYIKQYIKNDIKTIWKLY